MGKLQIKAKSFERLEGLLEKQQQNLTLNIEIDTHFVADSTLEKMAETFKSNKGETNICFNVLSKEAKRPFVMQVRKFVVEPNHEVLGTLEHMLGKEVITLSRS